MMLIRMDVHIRHVLNIVLSLATNCHFSYRGRGDLTSFINLYLPHHPYIVSSVEYIFIATLQPHEVETYSPTDV